MSRIDQYTRLSHLGDKVKGGTASKAETDEFMKSLYLNQKITKQQYDDYLANKNTEVVIGAALAVGVIWLIGTLLDEVFNRKK